MLYLAIALIIASGLFAFMRITLRHKRLSLQQFFLLYGFALIGLIFIFLGLTGRLHWLFVLIGSALPLLAGVSRWGLRLFRAAGLFASARKIFTELTGLRKDPKNHHFGSGEVSYEQALDVLGLHGHPSEEEIKLAHRQMIQKVHPDRGGSNLLASQINEAKLVLLNHV